MLEELAQLGRAFFDHHASNGPTEAINGRLEALQRAADQRRTVMVLGA